MTKDEQDKLIEIVKAAQVYYNDLVASAEASTNVATMNSESALSKEIEAAIYAGFLPYQLKAVLKK